MPIVIIEGGELVGKTSIVRELQDMIPYHTLIKLSGYPTSVEHDQHDRGIKVSKQYQLMTPIITHFGEEKIRTLIFDRFSTTERVMFPQSFLFGDIIGSLHHANNCGAIQFILTAPMGVLKARYNTRCKANNLECQKFSTILEIQERYKQEIMMSPIETHGINNDGSYSPHEIAEFIIRIAKIPLYQITD